MQVLQSVVSSLAAALILGIVVIAYRHPTAFAKIYGEVKPLLGSGALVTLGLMIGDSSTRDSLQAVIKKLEPTDAHVQQLLLPLVASHNEYGWALLIIAGIYVFGETLAGLPRVGIVALKSDDKHEDPPVSKSRPQVERRRNRKWKPAA